MVDIGDSGRHSDGGVFRNSEFGKKFCNNDLCFPPPENLPNSNSCVPYCIVGDAAFPLKPNLMRPFPGKFLCPEKRIFNYRLSRARRVVENTFGILATRWRIFRRPIIAKPEKVITITRAACCLHNFLQRGISPSDQMYCPPPFADHIDSSGNIVPGDWRLEADPTGNFLPLGRCGSNMYSTSAGHIRDAYANYFVTAGRVHWQDNIINRH